MFNSEIIMAGIAAATSVIVLLIRRIRRCSCCGCGCMARSTPTTPDAMSGAAPAVNEKTRVMAS